MIETGTASRLIDRAHASQHSPAFTTSMLILLGIASAVLYWWGRDLHRFTQWLAAYSWLFIGQLAIYATACHLIMRDADLSRTSRLLRAGAVVLFAMAFRAELAPERPFLSADMYRYVWDGRVQAAGINPYRHNPEAEELHELRDDQIFPNIAVEDRGWLSAYPPGAQVVFRIAYELMPTVTGFKLAMSLFDVLAVVLIMLALSGAGLDPARAIIFAWHPLSVFETAHSGHVESVYIAFVSLALYVWTRNRPAAAGAALGFSVLVKVIPALLLPAFLTTRAQPPANVKSALAKLWNHKNLRLVLAFLTTIAIGYAVYLGDGAQPFWFVSRYVGGEGFVDSGERYFLLSLARLVAPVPTFLFLCLAAAVLAALAVRQMVTSKRSAADIAGASLALVGAFLLLTTPRYAWYYVWLLPFLCFLPRLGWLYLASAASLLYLVWYTPFVYPELPLWLGSAIYAPTIALLIRDLKLARR